jgi:hypothetical protein
MKSPWKFLAQFIPQRRSAEASESSIGQHSDIERNKREPQQSSGLPPDATEDPLGSALEESQPAELLTSPTLDHLEPEMDATPAAAAPDDVDAFHAPKRRQTIESTLRSHVLPVENGPKKKSPRAPPTKGLTRAKRTRTDAIARSNAVANRSKSSQPASPRDAFFAEVEGLDEDIKQLRIQLARKLHLQNDQLKKMLERFDVS